MNILKPFLTVSFGTLISRVLGFLRDILIASFMGTSRFTDAFFLSFRLPNLFRRFFAEGAFNASFVPVFSKILDKKKRAKDFAICVFWTLTIFLIFFIFWAEIFMSAILVVFAPGIIGDKDQQDLVLELSRITFPYLFFISICSIVAAILSGHKKFWAFAISPAILNIILILCMVFLKSESKAHVLAYGVLIAGITQMSAMLFSLARLKFFSLREFFNIKIIHKKTKQLQEDLSNFLKKLFPALIGASVTQINLLIDTIIASFITFAVSYLYFADRLIQFPLALIGTAMGVATLPILSKKMKEDNKKGAIELQNKTLIHALLFAIPATIGLIIMAQDIVILLFERGEFTRENSVNVAYAIFAYSVGLPAFIMMKIFTNSFFANGDTKTPVRIGIFCVILNFILNIIFVAILYYLKLPTHIGIALATSISAWINIFLLQKILHKKQLFKFSNEFTKIFGKIIICTSTMCLFLFLYENFMPTRTLNFTAKILLEIFGAITIYFLTSTSIGLNKIFHKDK